jgi:hypothetical protein
MGDGPMTLALVELGVTTVDGFAPPKSGHVDIERVGAGRGPTEDVRLSRVQRERHGTIAGVAKQQRLGRADRRQRRPAAFVTYFRVCAKHRPAARIEAPQTDADGLGLHGHLTQSNRSASLIRPES